MKLSAQFLYAELPVQPAPFAQLVVQNRLQRLLCRIGSSARLCAITSFVQVLLIALILAQRKTFEQHCLLLAFSLHLL